MSPGVRNPVFDQAPGLVQERQHVHNGVGSTQMRRLRSTADAAFLVLDWTFSPGSSEGPHRHTADTVGLEQYFLLDGEVAVHVDDQRYALKPGDSLAIPPGPSRYLSNESGNPARVIVVFQRLDTGAAFGATTTSQS